MRRRPLVLVVDDERSAAVDFAHWLMRHGYAAIAVTSCSEARAAFDALPVDALVGQMALGDGSLFGLVRSLGANRPPVVIGFAGVEMAPSSSTEGFTCLVAPVDRDAIRRTLDARLARKESGELRKVVPPAALDDKRNAS